MSAFEVQIHQDLTDYLSEKLREAKNLGEANAALRECSGVENFFNSEMELAALKSEIGECFSKVQEPERAEYGDFQTNPNLALEICKLLKTKGLRPESIIEPTCGKGNFILAALQTFDSLREVDGVEIYEPYVWQAKFSILDFFRQNPDRAKPTIRITCQNVFQFDFSKFANGKRNVLVLGNPPWVTNAVLSTLESDNLPQKSNFKSHSGLDAMTGNGNFDIGESISLMMLRAFDGLSGHIAFLVKNAVVKNLIIEQKRNRFRAGSMEQLQIDAAKEFNVAVEASLFFAELDSEPEMTCTVKDFYSQKTANQFGWAGENFVSDIEKYRKTGHLDGKCPFEWRQGVKHDCSKIMELERSNGHFVNGVGREVFLEPDLVYRLLKSSDLKKPVIRGSRKFTIITQKKVGQATQHIQQFFPKTWEYLNLNRADFDNRKSSIYRDKPPFSIFGIGDYAFQPFKVAISGLYKTSTFSLVLPDNSKPIMLDDTCYFIGFSNFADATIATALLNSKPAQDLLHSLIFWDSKRPITKDLLMRLDLGKIAALFDFEKILNMVEGLDCNGQPLEFLEWENFRARLLPERAGQLSMF